jgi:hypothetical protein
MICSAKNLKQISDPEYYNKEMKRLKIKSRRAYKKKIRRALPRECKKIIHEIIDSEKNCTGKFLELNITK